MSQEDQERARATVISFANSVSDGIVPDFSMSGEFWAGSNEVSIEDHDKLAEQAPERLELNYEIATPTPMGVSVDHAIKADASIHQRQNENITTHCNTYEKDVVLDGNIQSDVNLGQDFGSVNSDTSGEESL